MPTIRSGYRFLELLDLMVQKRRTERPRHGQSIGADSETLADIVLVRMGWNEAGWLRTYLLF